MNEFANFCIKSESINLRQGHQGKQKSFGLSLALQKKWRPIYLIIQDVAEGVTGVYCEWGSKGWGWL